MIGLEQDKFKTLLTSRLQDYGVILDEEQPDKGIRYMGMGNRRRATVRVVINEDSDNFDSMLDYAIKSVFSQLDQGGEKT